LYEVPFSLPQELEISEMKIGYLADYFTPESNNWKNDSTSLEVFRSLGAMLEPVSLPEDLPIQALGIILSAEAAAAFDELTRSDQDSLLVRQNRRAWPNVFRSARFIPAVEYIQANRHRTLLIQQMHQVLREYDAVICPSFGGPQLTITNLTGHPCVVFPNGYNRLKSPTSLSIIGNLFEEGLILYLAEAYQQATSFEEEHPPLFNPKTTAQKP
ncbi:MAG: amidase, partial [Bacteroidota bacterium]